MRYPQHIVVSENAEFFSEKYEIRYISKNKRDFDEQHPLMACLKKIRRLFLQDHLNLKYETGHDHMLGRCEPSAIEWGAFG